MGRLTDLLFSLFALLVLLIALTVTGAFVLWALRSYVEWSLT